MILEVPEEDVTILVKADSERRENRYDVFISENFSSAACDWLYHNSEL